MGTAHWVGQYPIAGISLPPRPGAGQSGSVADVSGGMGRLCFRSRPPNRRPRRVVPGQGHDPPPGTTVLWRGFSRLADLVSGFEFTNPDMAETCG